jgi:hypothetical protein
VNNLFPLPGEGRGEGVFIDEAIFVMNSEP